MKNPQGMSTFLIVWIGQFVSLAGSTLTGFALSIWIYRETGSATSMALTMFFSFTPQILLFPVAGALVDRWNNRLKWAMAISDAGSAVGTLLLLVLASTQHLELWQIYALTALNSAFQAFQMPAFSKAMSVLVDEKQYGRANGLMSLAESVSQVGVPLFAAFLVGAIGITGVLWVDFISFCFAVASILLVHIPVPEQSNLGKQSKGSLWQESLWGFRFIFANPGLKALALLFAAANFLTTLSIAVFAPLVLTRSGGSQNALGIVQAAQGLGEITGGAVASSWEGFKKRYLTLALCLFGAALLGRFVIGLGTNYLVWSIGIFFAVVFMPLLNASSTALWMSKTPADVQGKVMSARRMIAWGVNPIAMLLAGFLADRLFTPAMKPGGLLSSSLGWLVGTGPGAGISLMFILSGLLGCLVAVALYFNPSIRNLEQPTEEAPSNSQLSSTG